MRAQRRRTKKLIVAFQFQFSNQAAWNCDDCRKRGLTTMRNCAFLNGRASHANKPVWARRAVTSAQCPKSVITAQSLAFLEEFQIWKRFGCTDVRSMSARSVEALSILEDQWRKEIEYISNAEGG
jgi:hypothetical protein